ncbi:hypothetical protein K435DRAFT_720266 [Dendrothele bispora CBS 962.96]|uniref:Gti1/Pac2 family-domain-containing protein n=1 Tax=Dendrothele bispora (strain CBS 962.96) TaxID=1314807 RepID=A0A4S8M934_DENBC|nr:hypothetical protein K435DRAFT_720266 [Dendrothele bispora CBS 962.96]
MQRPTLEHVRIRSTRDALQVFYGVARNKLPLITRRLDVEERRAIVPGNVYVWEERGANTETIGIGMERWTDGMGWGPSRVRDEFLFYHQKESDNEDEGSAATPWAQLLRRRDVSRYSRMAAQNSEPERLVKQTYSVHVSLPADRHRGIVRKWHLTAYFSQEQLNKLATIDSIRGIGDVSVPDGWFRSARANKNRNLNREPVHQHHAVVEAVVPSSPGVIGAGAAGTGMIPETSYSLASRRASVSSYHRGEYPMSSPVSEYSRSSPPSSAASSPTSTHASMVSTPLHGQLVPLEYLQSSPPPVRNEVDEQVIRRFNSLSAQGSLR